VSVDEKRAFAAALNSFSTMSETVKARGQRLQEAVEGISKMVETANRMISESDDDIVEKVAYGRHQKLIEMR
jgi:ABC-type transporter Mla subunit MlaD